MEVEVKTFQSNAVSFRVRRDTETVNLKFLAVQRCEFETP